MRSVTLSRYGADGWIRTSIEPVYKTGAFLMSSHVGKHEREELNPVRQFWRLAALPGAHSCKRPRPCDRGRFITYFCNSAFQYTSLTNFDQLSSRTWWSAYTGFHVGRTGCRAQHHAGLARRAVGLALVARHACQHAVRPARHATLRPRHDVVDRQLVRARLAAAVLADVAVALENVAAAERHGRLSACRS